MCIAIVKPKGSTIPTKETLKTCWEHNPDGAGFCFNNGKRVIIHKGYMTFDEFYNALKISDKLHNLKTRDVAIHFRISTSGGVKPQNTHPFAISNNMDDLIKTHSKCNGAFIHNGIISGYGDKQYSDTMYYVTDIISNIKDLEHSQKLIDRLATEKHSRFAILTRNGFILGGDWVKDNNIFYSNTTYKPYKKVTYTKYTPARRYEDVKKVRLCDWCEKPLTKAPNIIYDYYAHDWAGLCDDCKRENDYWVQLEKSKQLSYFDY